MNVKTNITLSLFTATLLISGCGSNSYYTPDETSVKGQAIADDYVANATVCLDTNNNLSCSDETLRTTTGEDGSFTLSNLSNDQLKSSNLVVDGDTKMVAPGIAAYYNKENFTVSPLLSLVTVSMDENTSYVQSTATLFYFFDQDVQNVFDLSRVNYIPIKNTNESTRALWALNKALIADQNYALILADNAQVSLRAEQTEVDPAFNTNVLEEAAALLSTTAISILEEHIRDAMVNSINPNYEFPEELIPKYTIEDDIQQMEQQELVENAMSIYTAGISIIPVFGEAVASILDSFWPQPALSEISRELYAQAQVMIETNIAKEKYQYYNNRFNNARNLLKEYIDTPIDNDVVIALKRQKFQEAKAELDSLLVDLLGAEGTDNLNHSKMFMPLAQVAYITQFFMLRDQYNFPEYTIIDWDKKTNDSETEEKTLENQEITRKIVLDEWMKEYVKYRDKFFGSDGKGGTNAMYNQFINWRISDKFIAHGTAPNGSPLFTRQDWQTTTTYFRDYKDAFTNLDMRFGRIVRDKDEPYDRDAAPLNQFKNLDYWKANFDSYASAITQRLRSSSTLDVAKLLVPLSYLPRFFPQDDSVMYYQNIKVDDNTTVKDIIPEAQGVLSTIFPEELQQIKVGPLSQPCFTFYYLNAYDRTYECKQYDDATTLASSNANDTIKSIDLNFLNARTTLSPGNTLETNALFGMDITYDSGATASYYHGGNAGLDKQVITLNTDSGYLTGMVDFNSYHADAVGSTEHTHIQAFAWQISSYANGKVSEVNTTTVPALHKNPNPIAGPIGTLDMQIVGFSMDNKNEGFVHTDMLYTIFGYRPDIWTNK